MSEHVAIVAGAGGELGRVTAEKLAAAGFTVVGVDRSEEGLKELPDSIRREAANPADQAAARSVVDRVAAEVGPPEVLVNTIGMFHPGDALTATVCMGRPKPSKYSITSLYCAKLRALAGIEVTSICGVIVWM